MKKPLGFGPNKRNGILLPKLFLPTVRKNCSSDREKLWKLEQLEFKLEKNYWDLEPCRKS